MSYASFRKNNNDIEQLKDRYNKMNGRNTFSEFDETYWNPNHVRGETGQGEVIMRFLPAPSDGQGGQEPDNIVKYHNYYVNRNGKTYNNRGRDSMGYDVADPVAEYNRPIWQDDELSKKEKLSRIVDKSQYFVANIFIVKDPNKPQNEGKVFRWRFGPQINNMITEQLFPEFETDEACVIFDPIDGADFILRVTTNTIPDRNNGEPKKVPSYANSKFAKPSQRWSLEEFDAIWAQCHSLQSEIAEDKFKSYDDLKKQFDRVMGETKKASSEPTKQSASRNQAKEKAPEKSMDEILDDEIPWGNDEDESPVDNTSSDDFLEKLSESTVSEGESEDWFSSLK